MHDKLSEWALIAAAQKWEESERRVGPPLLVVDALANLLEHVLGELLEAELVLPLPVLAGVLVVQGTRPRQSNVVAEVGLIVNLIAKSPNHFQD